MQFIEGKKEGLMNIPIDIQDLRHFLGHRKHLRFLCKVTSLISYVQARGEQRTVHLDFRKVFHTVSVTSSLTNGGSSAQVSRQ